MGWTIKEQKIDLKIPTAVYTWDVPYAVYVHEGVFLSSGRKLPARPWVDYSIQNYNFIESLEYNLRATNDIKKSFMLMTVEFGEFNQKAIASNIWEWPNMTYRKSGEVVFSPRNIVDTGALKNSFRLNYREQ